MEWVDQDRRAHDETDLLFRHAWTELSQHLRSDEVALADVNSISPFQNGATGTQKQDEGHSCENAATGFGETLQHREWDCRNEMY